MTYKEFAATLEQGKNIYEQLFSKYGEAIL